MRNPSLLLFSFAFLGLTACDDDPEQEPQGTAGSQAKCEILPLATEVSGRALQATITRREEVIAACARDHRLACNASPSSGRIPSG